MCALDPIQKWRDAHHWQRKLSNKKNAREFAKKHDCEVPVLFWCGRDINEIEFNNLPDQFVLKPTIGHSSRHVYVIDKGVNLLDKSSYSGKGLSKIMAAQLEQHANLEFLIEEFVRTEQGDYKIPINYKFHTFNGVIAGINVINRAGPKEGFMRAYDENWNLIKDISNDFPKGPYQDPPACLSEMIKQAKTLSRAYQIYVRLDFFATHKGAIFGEFTPTPSVGNYFTRAADKKFINYWDKNCKGMI
jgi:hypothetical protein